MPVSAEKKYSRCMCAAYACMMLFVAACHPDNKAPQFPADHGPHFNCKTEWWYFTGVVTTLQGKTLGYECTIFKSRAPIKNEFAYLGQIAVSDPETSDYFFGETATSPPVAGIVSGRPQVVIQNFSYDYTDNTTIYIQGTGEDLSIDLALQPVDAVLLHGRDGAITMGDGLPSYYYSFTNLATSGTIAHNGKNDGIVSGRSWMDHQWGNFTALGALWDWFSLRFDDGGALMLFRFRNVFGKTVRSNWTYRSSAGEVAYGASFTVASDRVYEDIPELCRYPLDWTVTVPDLDAQFSVKPLFDDQAFYSSMTPAYWEGLCSFQGSLQGATVAGKAYVELTGYCGLAPRSE